ncbi:MAG TPA: branched-chain amino acid ABC transporter permease [Thermomicrobiales bacterium]|nr:branched-chain amino acid ABC transporter permease [Thermomicrobiales bacterium]
MAASIASRTDVFFQERREIERQRLWKVLVGAAIVALYPLIDSALGLGLLGSWIPILVYVLLALGLNIVVGYAGLLDLGYVAFFVIGAYAQAFLTSPSSVFVQKGWVPEFMQNFWPAMAVSWVVAAICGAIIGAPTLRLRGDYLAIVTLGFGEIVPDFFTNTVSVTRGPQGIGQITKPPTIPLPFGWSIGFGTQNQWQWFWLILFVGLLSLFVITRLYDSRMGRAWQAIREDEIAAASMGINPVRTKLWAFALGASFSGFAGSLYSGYVGVVYPDQFQFSLSIVILSMVILGGIGNIYGVLAGALIIGTFDRILAEKLNGPMNWLGEQITWGPVAPIGNFLANHSLTSDRFLIFGLALVLIMLLRPGGLFPSARRAAEMKGEDNNYTFDEDEADQSLREAREGDVGNREGDI